MISSVVKVLSWVIRINFSVLSSPYQYQQNIIDAVDDGMSEMTSNIKLGKSFRLYR